MGGGHHCALRGVNTMRKRLPTRRPVRPALHDAHALATDARVLRLSALRLQKVVRHHLLHEALTERDEPLRDTDVVLIRRELTRMDGALARLIARFGKD